MIEYRTFRNTDPPGLVGVWNETMTGRGATQLRNASPLERHVFAKSYFDPAGFIVAHEGKTLAGFAHAGFGPNNAQTYLSTAVGVTCLLAVRPAFQRQGIGSELLRRCEVYLKSKGARTIYAGAMPPLDPFYFGLYGGSDLPGWLASDSAAAPFLEFSGYRPFDTHLVFQRRMEGTINVADARFAGLRRKYTMRVLPVVPVKTWWSECVLGLIEPLEFRLEEVGSGRPVARAEAWEMEGFSWRWGVPSAGILSIQVREDLQRQGVGKFLLMHVLRHLQEQYYGLIELQVPERNQPAVRLVGSVGFQQVDFGRMYRREKEHE